MSDIPENAPEHCPGTQSESAGKVAPCQGCPNKEICSSGLPRAPDPAIEQIKDRMATVKHKILILSGKGGVGKSTFSSTLARALAETNISRQIGLLDMDICGPSLPRMMGCESEQIHQSLSGWSPIYIEENLCIMSIGFLLSSLDDAVIWRGPRKNGIIKQFLKDVDWGQIDYMIIDTPPGTSDEHLSIIQYLSGVNVDGAILVTTPQEVAMADVRKEANFCSKVKLPILGVVENMSGFVCPKCDKESIIFPATSGGAEQMCKDLSLVFLGKVPLDPRIGQCCDEGVSIFTECADSPATVAILQLASKLINLCEKVI